MNKSLINKKVWHDPKYFLGFGFGSGLSSIAPGTCGTLAAIPLVMILSPYSLIYWLAIVLLSIVGTYCADKITKDLNIDDFSGIVIDEIVGFLITMSLVPVTWISLTLGFILFRIFDIWKPFPISLADEKIKGGIGIMLDDILAAIPAALLLLFITKLL